MSSQLNRDSNHPAELEQSIQELESAQESEHKESQQGLMLRRLLPRIEESALISVLEDWKWEQFRSETQSAPDAKMRVASISSGRHQAAEGLARTKSFLEVHCWHIDSFQASRTQDHISLESSPPDNLKILCEADLPEIRFQLAIASLITTSEAELSRDYLQQLYHRLDIGGCLIVTVDNPEDKWVHDQLKVFEKSVKVRKAAGAMIYWVEKSTELKKLRDFTCQLAFRDCDELIHLVTRPGVFSHRQLDNGARQLLDAVDVYPEARLIDIGCGAGSVALGLAKRDPSAHVHAVDANARAIDCVRRGIALNGLENLSVEVNPTGIYGEPESYDMALANPPYFGDFRIAEKFIIAAHRSLRKGGRLVIVNKQPSWYEENLTRWFQECEVFPSRRYFIASGTK